MKTTEEIQQLATEALTALKAVNLVSMDVRHLTNVTDVMLVCTGRSNRHTRSLAENVVTTAKAARVSYIKMEGDKEGEWVIVDLGDVVVHVMLAETRALYDLEDLWKKHAHSSARRRE